MLEQDDQKAPKAKYSAEVLDTIFGQALAAQGLLSQ